MRLLIAATGGFTTYLIVGSLSGQILMALDNRSWFQAAKMIRRVDSVEFESDFALSKGLSDGVRRRIEDATIRIVFLWSYRWPPRSRGEMFGGERPSLLRLVEHRLEAGDRLPAPSGSRG